MAVIGREAARAPLTSADINDGIITADDLIDTLDLSGKTITLGALSATGNISFGDNAKAIFGAGSDLQIYHTGSNSIIDDLGTGNLLIRSDGAAISLQVNSKNSVRAVADEDVELYYNGSEKLATTATGIDVTGTVTATASDTNPAIFSSTSGSNFTDLFFRHASSSFTNAVRLRAVSDGLAIFTSDVQEAMRIDSSGNVGIGESSPNSKLRVKDSDTTVATLESTGSNAFMSFIDSGTGSRTHVQIGSEDNAMVFHTNDSEAMRIDSSGNVLVNTTAIPTGLGASNTKLILSNFEDAPEFVAYNSDNALALGDKIGAYLFGNDDNNATEDHFAGMWAKSSGTTGAMDIHFAAGKVNYEDDSPHMTLDYNGNLLVGKSSSDVGATAGFEWYDTANVLTLTRSGGQALSVNRLSTDGDVVTFRKDGTTVGSIQSQPGNIMAIGSSGTGILFNSSANCLNPFSPSLSSSVDATLDIGKSNFRFKDLYRSGSTISTSDRNMKQDERPLTEAEAAAAQACKGLLKAFRFIDAVETDGDGAHIHFGIIAQDLQAAFEAEGLDAKNYAMFRPSTFTDDEGNEQTRLGVCYENLLAFIIAAL